MKTSPQQTLEEKWQGPRVNVTVDILVYNLQTKEVLLGRKSKDAPDQWRIPGGFVDVKDDHFIDSAYRELEEETSIQPCMLLHSLVYLGDHKVPDPRFATKKDVIMTNFYLGYIDFNCLESVQAGDDLEEVRWFDIDCFIENLHSHHQHLGKIAYEYITSKD